MGVNRYVLFQKALTKVPDPSALKTFSLSKYNAIKKLNSYLLSKQVFSNIFKRFA